MKKEIAFLSFVFLLFSCKKEASISLFNGKNLDGWHIDVPVKDSLPDTLNPFIVKKGELISLGTPRGHLITNKSYSNYRLEVVYKFTGEPGNGGILLHASKPRVLYKMFPKSIEVQMEHGNAGDFWCIHQDIEVNNMEEYRGPEEKWGIREGDNRRIVAIKKNLEKPLGKWNSMTIECINNQIKVWVNGHLANYGYNATTNMGAIAIAIQAEGAAVAFRKIVLTPISSSTKYDDSKQ
ncbi:DUF1080 domain-containing protein [uncultured Maribacter sp.]|uniref:3-keto-disaccharide hydrolase n=1 Tax=uncultured Maribacter sp. TaxID=431308 RepID=UPI0026207401|nr:DUF1080 domain-containing protein [uncultured Maribacter sp.]